MENFKDDVSETYSDSITEISRKTVAYADLPCKNINIKIEILHSNGNRLFRDIIIQYSAKQKYLQWLEYKRTFDVNISMIALETDNPMIKTDEMSLQSMVYKLRQIFDLNVYNEEDEIVELGAKLFYDMRKPPIDISIIDIDDPNNHVQTEKFITYSLQALKVKKARPMERFARKKKKRSIFRRKKK